MYQPRRALRVDVMQGRAGEELAAIEEKFAEVRGWWARREKGPRSIYLPRTVTSSAVVARRDG